MIICGNVNGVAQIARLTITDLLDAEVPPK